MTNTHRERKGPATEAAEQTHAMRREGDNWVTAFDAAMGALAGRHGSDERQQKAREDRRQQGDTENSQDHKAAHGSGLLLRGRNGAIGRVIDQRPAVRVRPSRVRDTDPLGIWIQALANSLAAGGALQGGAVFRWQHADPRGPWVHVATIWIAQGGGHTRVALEVIHGQGNFELPDGFGFLRHAQSLIYLDFDVKEY